MAPQITGEIKMDSALTATSVLPDSSTNFPGLYWYNEHEIHSALDKIANPGHKQDTYVP